jgi:hypothetical protein
MNNLTAGKVAGGASPDADAALVARAVERRVALQEYQAQMVGRILDAAGVKRDTKDYTAEVLAEVERYESACPACGQLEWTTEDGDPECRRCGCTFSEAQAQADYREQRVDAGDVL